MFLNYASNLSATKEQTFFVGNENIQATTSDEDVGIVFERTLSMEQEVEAVWKSAFLDIRSN